MKHKFLAVACLVTMIGAVTTAGAATLDFQAESAGNERGVTNGYVLNSVNTDFTNVTLSATYNGAAANAYFDNGAALGVCHTGLTGSNQCVTASDDNVTANETLTLAFDGLRTVSGLSFMAEGHTNLFSDTLTLLFGVNGGALASYTFNDLRNAVFGGVSSITFGYGGARPDQYYLQGATVAAVPVPAAGMMLLGGLGMLGFGARRRTLRTA